MCNEVWVSLSDENEIGCDQPRLCYGSYCVSQKKQASTNGVPSYKFCFEGYRIYII